MNNLENPFIRNKIAKLLHKSYLKDMHKELLKVEKHIYLYVEDNTFITKFKFPNAIPENKKGYADSTDFDEDDRYIGYLDHLGMIGGSLSEFADFYNTNFLEF